HVCPEAAVAGRMRIALHISVLVMDSVSSHPEKRSALQRERRANRQKVFNPFISLEPAVSEQAVIPHADAQAARNPPQKDGNEECLPGEHEQRRDGAHVKCCHEKSCELADRFSKRAITLKEFHE